MRSSGFPCRYAGCQVAFQVEDQRSMSALNAAADKRTEHEVAVHGYHHVSFEEVPVPSPYQRSLKKAPSIDGAERRPS